MELILVVLQNIWGWISGHETLTAGVLALLGGWFGIKAGAKAALKERLARLDDERSSLKAYPRSQDS